MVEILTGGLKIIIVLQNLLNTHINRGERERKTALTEYIPVSEIE